METIWDYWCIYIYVYFIIKYFKFIKQPGVVMKYVGELITIYQMIIVYYHELWYFILFNNFLIINNHIYTYNINPIGLIALFIVNLHIRATF